MLNITFNLSGFGDMMNSDIVPSGAVKVYATKIFTVIR